MLGVVVTMLPTKGPDSYGYGSYTYGSTHDLDGETSTDRRKAKKAKKAKSAKKRATARA